MTEPRPLITVDAPIATEAGAATSSSVSRVLAALAGITVLLVGALVTLGGALAGALGVWFATMIAKRRGQALSRLMAWVGAVATTAVAALIVGGVLLAKAPDGTITNFTAMIDSVQKAQAPTAGISPADSANIARVTKPAMAIGGLIGGYIVLMMLATIYGSVGWSGAMLLVYAGTGAWLGRRAPPARTSALLLVLGLLVGPETIVAQEMPIHLRIDAKDRGCVPVLDTTRFPGLTLPLWRFGVYESGADTLRKSSAAYWCELPTAEPVVAIVIWREWGNAPLPGGCTDMIRYSRASVGGLRFERRGRVDLRDAHPVDEPSRKGPPITARGAVIVSEYDGRVTRFICHTGRWYVSTS